MFSRIKSYFGLTAFFTSIACGAQVPKATHATSASPLACSPGVIRNDVDLSRYTDCRVVTGDLRIETGYLTNLQGLEGLKSISGELTIADNPRLTSLDGLQGLKLVGALHVRDNPRLESIESLQGLLATRAVSIVNQRKLRSLHGLEGLHRVSSLEITNTGLFNTRGLEQLRQVGELTIRRNAALISLAGLARVERADSVVIEGNPRLCAGYGLLPSLATLKNPAYVRKNAGLSRSDVEAFVARVRLSPADPFLTTASR